MWLDLRERIAANTPRHHPAAEPRGAFHGRDAPPEVRARWAVNYARHHLTKYDEALEEVAGKIGVAEATQAIWRKVYAAVAAAYPELAEECRRQAERRGVELNPEASAARVEDIAT